MTHTFRYDRIWRDDPGRSRAFYGAVSTKTPLSVLGGRTMQRRLLNKIVLGGKTTRRMQHRFLNKIVLGGKTMQRRFLSKIDLGGKTMR